MRKVLRIAGIAANPTNLRGPQRFPSGSVWVIDTERHTQTVVAKSGEYRSPVFEPGDQSLLALNGEDLVRISLSGGAPRKLFTIAGVLKIVGFSRDSRDEVLILTQGHGDAPAVVGLLSLTSGRTTPLDYNQDSDDQRLVNHLAGWDRDYGDILLFVRRQRKETLLGEAEISNIIINKRLD